jgi:hypothetical protein
LGLVLGFVSSAWACGSNSANDSQFVDDGGADADAAAEDVSTDVGQFGGGDAAADAASSTDSAFFGDAPAGLSISPSGLQTITVTVGQAPTNLPMFTALLNGVPVTAAWGIDRGDIGVVPGGPAETVTFTPSGTTGGLVTITAGFNGKTATVQVFVKLVASQSGFTTNAAEQNQIATTVAQLTAGGGVGGVGGEGLGVPVTDMATLQALATPSTNGSSEGFTMLYPYNGTVWPRGILAPLLQWSGAFPGEAGTGPGVDAIEVTLATTSGSYSWTGTFGPPTILTTTNGPFIRMPIPQDVWATATNTAGGTTPNNMPDQLVLNLTVAKDGVGYGPFTETWPVAPGLLSGIIYYNSYGTQLAKNFAGGVGGDGTFGAAVLSIHVGDSAPHLVAGGSGTTDGSQCRVCHSVAAQGSSLALQQYNGGADNITSVFDLTVTPAIEHVQPNNTDWFPAVYPNGSMLLTKWAQLYPMPVDSTAISTTGLTEFTDLGTPSFSPDGTQVAMNPTQGSMVTSPQQLYVMGFTETTDDASTPGDAATADAGPSITGAFGSPVLVADYTGQPANTRPGWPAFFPDGKSLAFQLQSDPGYDGNQDDLRTRKGALDQIAWTSTTDAQHVTILDALDGVGSAAAGDAGDAGTAVSTLPTYPGGVNMNCTADGYQVGNIDPKHSNDVNYNYEPTVAPVAAGGYVWVVFTSRRMYGSEATIPPFCSDPRGVNLVENITTKKLWVAAVNLGAAPGTDVSHPAFYLPGQELLAGNSRGFWVLDPCLADGNSCTAGDQCCNGYCEPAASGGDAGSLICANTPPNNSCSAVNDKCSTSADCCTSTNKCVNGFCTVAASAPGAQ